MGRDRALAECKARAEACKILQANDLVVVDIHGVLQKLIEEIGALQPPTPSHTIN